MIRKTYLKKINQSFKIHPVVGLLGSRQCGKTTLAHQFKRQHREKCHVFDLEDPEDLTAWNNPKAVFESLKGTIIIDEIQRRPELFPHLRVLVDKEKRKRKILILGSASQELIRQSSESLTGRICYIELTPFSQHELNIDNFSKLWQRGGYPLSYLSKTAQASFAWRKAYISSFLERDIPNLGIKIPAPTLLRFWAMISHYHGKVINYSELGRSFGIADTTVRKYLDILSMTFMIRQLQPWFENIKKRQVKNPKIYFRDSGLFHALLPIKNQRELLSHVKLGASWEGFALEQVIRQLGLEPQEVYFWSVHGQGEIDLLFHKKGKKIGMEFKFSQTPSITRSMLFAKNQLGLDRVFCIYPGKKHIPLTKGMDAYGLDCIKEIPI